MWSVSSFLFAKEAVHRQIVSEQSEYLNEDVFYCALSRVVKRPQNVFYAQWLIFVQRDNWSRMKWGQPLRVPLICMPAAWPPVGKFNSQSICELEPFDVFLNKLSGLAVVDGCFDLFLMRSPLPCILRCRKKKKVIGVDCFASFQKFLPHPKSPSQHFFLHIASWIQSCVKSPSFKTL